MIFYMLFPQALSPSSVTRSNPRATMPPLWGFPFPLSPDLPPEMQRKDKEMLHS